MRKIIIKMIHSSHKMRFSMSSLYDEICDVCGATENALSTLKLKCSKGNRKIKNEKD